MASRENMWRNVPKKQRKHLLTEAAKPFVTTCACLESMNATGLPAEQHWKTCFWPMWTDHPPSTVAFATKEILPSGNRIACQEVLSYDTLPVHRTLAKKSIVFLK
jgi:hypothetical protein